MAFAAQQSKRLLKKLGWVSVDEVPESGWDRMEVQSHHRQEDSSPSVLRYVTTYYESYKKGDDYILVTDGAECITVNAEMLQCVSAGPETGRENTGFFTIGGSEKTVFEWITWAANGCETNNRPRYGFNYVSLSGSACT